MDLYDTMAEHRELIISNELWETYMNNGSRMLNAGTSNDGTFYFAYLPANRLELFMLLESDRMANPIFREFYTERDVVMEELRMSQNEPEDVLYYSFMSTAYTASHVRRAGPRMGVGRVDDHARRPPGLLRHELRAEQRHRLLRRRRDPDDVKELAEKYFGQDRPRRGPARPHHAASPSSRESAASSSSRTRSRRS